MTSTAAIWLCVFVLHLEDKHAEHAKPAVPSESAIPISFPRSTLSTGHFILCACVCLRRLKHMRNDVMHCMLQPH